MTIYAQDYIRRTFEEVGMEAPAIHPHPTQAGRYQLRPVEPYNSQQLTEVSQLFADVSPYDDGAEISVPDQYPPAPAAAAPGRDWLTPENTLARRLEQVLIEHQLIANVKAITDIVGSLVVKFNGATPAVPAGMKRADLAQAGLVEIKTGSPGTWTIRVSEMWRIELQAGEMLRQLREQNADQLRRIDALKADLADAQDRIAEKDARVELMRAERDKYHSDLMAMEAQITTPQMPKWAPLRSDFGYTMPRGCKLHIATSLSILNDFMGQGGKLIGQPEIVSATELYALVEMREHVPARLPNYAGKVTMINGHRPLMSRDARIQRDNGEVFETIRATPRTPVQPMTPLGGVS
jgi:hypothetical protein